MSSLKNTTINDTGYLQLPSGTTAQRPAAAAGMMRYNTDLGTSEYYANGTWVPMVIPFKERTIITNAYNLGGYKDSVSWNNVNRTIAATDTTTNLGDGSLERSVNYQPGACSLTTAYIFGAHNAMAVSSNYIIAYNMTSETQVTTGFSRTMAASRIRHGTIFQEHYFCWMSGGSSAVIEEFNLTTGVISSATATWSTADAWGMSHEAQGLFFTNESASVFVYATRTSIVRGGTAPSAHHQQKTVNSKGNFCYAGNEGTYNGGYNLRRTNMYVNTTVGTTAKPIGNCGEENFTMGQEHQYMIGNYDGGGQNNGSWRFNYATETGWVGGTTMQPKGHLGSSSATNAWRP